MKPLSRLVFLALLFPPLLSALPEATVGASDSTSIRDQVELADPAAFPPGYPTFLKEVYLRFRHGDRATGEAPDTRKLIAAAKAHLEDADFDEFLGRFGLDSGNPEEIELEVSAQIMRLQRREAYHSFVKRFGEADPLERIELVKESVDPKELEYALRQCEVEEFGLLVQQVLDKDGFGPHTSQDKALLATSRRKSVWH